MTIYSGGVLNTNKTRNLLLKVLNYLVIFLLFHFSCVSQIIFNQVIPENKEFTQSFFLKKKSFVKITIDSISFNQGVTFNVIDSTFKKSSIITDNPLIEFIDRGFSKNSNGDIASYYLLNSGYYVVTKVLDGTRINVKNYKKGFPETKLQIYSHDIDTLCEKLNLFSGWLEKTKMSDLYDLFGVFDLKKIDNSQLSELSEIINSTADWVTYQNGTRPKYVIFLKNHRIAPHYWQGGRDITEFFYDKIISEISFELGKPKNSFFILNPPRNCFPNNVLINKENKASLFGAPDACCAWCGTDASNKVWSLRIQLSCAEIDIGDLIKLKGKQLKQPLEISQLMYDFKEFADITFKKKNGLLQLVTINKFGFDCIVREMKGEVIPRSNHWELIYISCTPSIIGSEGKIKLTISGGYSGGLGNYPADTNFDKAFDEIDCCNYAKALLTDFQNHLNRKYVK